MATLDDKILGEKLHNYCSSSEDEEEDGGGCDEKSTSEKSSNPPVNNWSGTASNTGPKGVLEDWRRYKQMEAENRQEMEKERIALAKKLTLTVKTQREEEEDLKNKDIEDELNELMDEDFLLKYQKKRMQELMSQLQKTPNFGEVYTLKSKDEFLDAIDKEDPKVTIVVHIYRDKTLACVTMDGCLNVLADQHPAVKFCRISVDIAGMSNLFRVEGVPALLIYKGGQIIGNFVQLSKELGDDFFATDVEKFLIEYGILPE